jgi:hypothetical protein
MAVRRSRYARCGWTHPIPNGRTSAQDPGSDPLFGWRQISPRGPADQLGLAMLQWGHDFSAVDRGGHFSAIIGVEKRRFSRKLLTCYNTFRKKPFVCSNFLYAQTHHASPGKTDITSMRENGMSSIPSYPSVWPGWPCLAGACSPDLVQLCD